MYFALLSLVAALEHTFRPSFKVRETTPPPSPTFMEADRRVFEDYFCLGEPRG